MSTNDNDAEAQNTASYDAAAYGRAALLLVESLIHGLCKRSALRVDEAVAIVERAVDVQAELSETADDQTALAMSHSYTLLLSIAMSLRADLRSSPLPPHLVT